jgi:hypothetical protein
MRLAVGAASVLALAVPTNGCSRTPPSEANSFYLPDAGLTVILPPVWHAVEPDVLVKLARKTRAAGVPFEKAGLKNVAAFYRGVRPAKSYVGSEFMLVETTPGQITPEEFLKLFPFAKSATEHDANALLTKYGAQASIGAAVYRQDLQMVVVPLAISLPDGTRLLMRSYEIPTRQQHVSVIVYAPERTSAVVFAEFEGTLPLLRLDEAAKLEGNWFERLRALIK